MDISQHCNLLRKTDCTGKRPDLGCFLLFTWQWEVIPSLGSGHSLGSGRFEGDFHEHLADLIKIKEVDSYHQNRMG